MSGALSVLTDAEVQESITNIALWLQSNSHNSPHGKAQEVFIEDLAIAVPGECLFPELNSVNEDATREEEKGVLVYTDESDDKYLWLRSCWYALEKVLNTPAPKNGWVRTTNLGERLLMLILTQLDYTAKESEAEVPYGCSPLSDPAYLLWISNRPVGMCSLKRKGTSIWGEDDVYCCDTLDTLYVRPCVRRQGHTMALLRLLTTQLPPGEHLGLSHPISLSMCAVLLKFVQVYPELRDTLWTLDEDGEVSGTVLLMLGSLMVRGVLQAPISNPSQSQMRDTQQNSIKYQQESQQMITDKVPSSKIITSQMKTQCQVNQNPETQEVDEPCDTS